MRSKYVKRTKRALALIMAASLVMNGVSLNVSASGNRVEGSGTLDDPKVTTTSTTDSDGFTTTIINTVASGSNADDERIQYQTIETLQKNKDGELINQSLSSNKKMVSTSSDADYIDYYFQEVVQSDIEKDGNGKVLSDSGYREGFEEYTVMNENDVEPVSVVLNMPLNSGSTSKGSQKSVKTTDLDNEDYPYAWSEITRYPRTVTASMSNAEIKYIDSVKNEMTPIKELKIGVNSALDLSERKETYAPKSEVHKGYDFAMTGYGQVSKISLQLENVNTKEEMQAYPQHFMVTDVNDLEKEQFVTYCVDMPTNVVSGYWYRIDNLNVGTYYATQDAQEKIRSIVLNGYWGTEQGTGSMSKIVSDLTAAYNDGRIPGFAKVEDVTCITPGEAFTATQAAIWKYSNSDVKILDLAYQRADNGEQQSVAKNKEDRVEMFYNYLCALAENAKATDMDETPVLSERNFIDNVSITVGSKEEHTEQYHVDLTFTLDTKVDQSKDDLVMLLKCDEEDIQKKVRIAGTPQAGEEIAEIKVDGNRTQCTVKDLMITEGTPVSFSFQLQGLQNLEYGVYVFTPYGGRSKSQSLVGIASGKKAVGLELSADISFEVEENVKEVKNGWKEVWDLEGATVELTVNKVWKNDSQSIRPEYVKVQLLKDNVVYGVATLNDANDWTYTWEKLDADSEWSVKESGIPQGYEVEIDEDNGNFIITNTYKTEPESTKPTESKPTDPEPTEPESSAPETTAPESSEPETTTPAWVDDDDDEPETTVPPTTVPETSAPALETTPAEPTSPTVTYRGVEIPREVLDRYPGRTLDELFEMGVLGEYFENIPTGLLPATGEPLSGWSILAIISSIGLAILTLFDKKRNEG